MCYPDVVAEAKFDILRQKEELRRNEIGTYDQDNPALDFRASLIQHNHAFGRASKADVSFEQRHTLRTLYRVCIPPRKEDMRPRDPFDRLDPGFFDRGMDEWRKEYNQFWDKFLRLHVQDEYDLEDVFESVSPKFMKRFVTEFLPERIDWGSWMAKKWLSEMCLTQDVPRQYMQSVSGFRTAKVVKPIMDHMGNEKDITYTQIGLSGTSVVCNDVGLSPGKPEFINHCLHVAETWFFRKTTCFITDWVKRFALETWSDILESEVDPADECPERPSLETGLLEYYSREVLG